jgi:DNA (cytosine-5)-methyltransferase 1
MSKLVALDLFCGCGGLTLGLKRAGFKVVGAVDCDPLAIETYCKNHKEVMVWHRDIRSLTVTEVKKKLGLRKGELDLLAGCPPCQGFSSIRTLNGSRKIKDPRNDLLSEFLRFVRGLRPKAVMLENVPGLAADRRFSGFRAELEALDYHVDHRILDAADYGVPQRRRRLILLGGRVEPIDFAPPSQKHRTVFDAIGSLPRPELSKDPLHKVSEQRSHRIMNLIKLIPKDGGSRGDLSLRYQLPCHKRCDGFKDIYGRMAWYDVAPTITGGCLNPSKGRFLHPEQNRAITLREATLLQGFPRGYVLSLRRGRFAAAEMIGNALPPGFVKRHAKQIVRFLNRN